MAYDAWKADDSLYVRHEPDRDDVLQLRVPRYRLSYFEDRGLRHMVARLDVMTRPERGWQQLDVAIVSYDESAYEWSYSGAVAKLRAQRAETKAYIRNLRVAS